MIVIWEAHMCFILPTCHTDMTDAIAYDLCYMGVTWKISYLPHVSKLSDTHIAFSYSAHIGFTYACHLIRQYVIYVFHVTLSHDSHMTNSYMVYIVYLPNTDITDANAYDVCQIEVKCMETRYQL